MRDRLELLLIQIAELEQSRDAVLEDENPDRAAGMIQQLAKLRGAGVQSAAVLVREGLVCEFANGKALGSYAGLTATPYSRGRTEREQGIGKAGNARLRTVMVALAWLWQRYRPDSAQVSWFRERISGTGRRMRKVMQGDGGGAGAEAVDRLAAVRDKRRCPGGRGHETHSLIPPKIEPKSHDGPGPWIQGGVAVVRPGGLVHSHRLKEWCRPPGALLSRMPDRGGGSAPPDARFAGKTWVDESSALVDQRNRAAALKSEERRNDVA